MPVNLRVRCFLTCSSIVFSAPLYGRKRPKIAAMEVLQITISGELVGNSLAAVPPAATADENKRAPILGKMLYALLSANSSAISLAASADAVRSLREHRSVSS